MIDPSLFPESVQKVVFIIVVFFGSAIGAEYVKLKMRKGSHNGNERREANTLVIDKETITSVVSTFKDHTRTQQQIADTLENFGKKIESHTEAIDRQSDIVGKYIDITRQQVNMLKEIHERAIRS